VGVLSVKYEGFIEGLAKGEGGGLVAYAASIRVMLAATVGVGNLGFVAVLPSIQASCSLIFAAKDG
jgi:hypothetical protein